MKLTLALILALAMPAHAGGPNMILEEPEIMAPRPTGQWILPIIIGGIVLCALACGKDEAPKVVCREGC